MFNLFRIFRRAGGRADKARGACLRGFAAAQVSRTLAAWQFDGGFSNDEIGAQLAVIRARSRERQKNDEYIANYIRSFRVNVVGLGFQLRAQPSVSPYNPEIDERAKAFLQYHFWKWSKSRVECDVSGRRALPGIFRLMAANWARDGEALALIERNAPTAYGIQLRVVRPDCLDETINRSVSASVVIRNGVEVDRFSGRPLAYWFRAAREDPSAVYVGASSRVVRVPASDVIHVFSVEDAAQTRGVPLTHPVLKKSKMLDQFNEAELVAAIDETNTIGTFTDKQARTPEGAGIGLDEGDAYTTADKAAFTQKSEPGTKLWLDGDIDFSWHSPNHPNREVTPFKKTWLRDIACGLGVDYPIFANDPGDANFSSIRAGTIAMRDGWKVLQDEFIQMAVTPVYEAWLSSFLARPVANPYVPGDFARLCEHEFQGRTWDWVDPLKDVNAAAVAVEHGWKTNEEITAQYGGADFLENCNRLKIENDAKKAAGIAAADAAESEEDQDDEGQD